MGVRVDKGVIEDEEHQGLGHSRLRKISFTQRAKRNWIAQIIEAIIMGENPLMWF